MRWWMLGLGGVLIMGFAVQLHTIRAQNETIIGMFRAQESLAKDLMKYGGLPARVAALEAQWCEPSLLLDDTVRTLLDMKSVVDALTGQQGGPPRRMGKGK